MRNRWMLAGLLAALVATAPGCSRPAADGAGPRLSAPAAVHVKTVHPRTGRDRQVTVEQPAEVAAYYRASLYAEVSGTVRFLEKAMGDPVRAGERLIEIDPVQAQQGSPKAVLRAPIDGVISARTVDPGAFVPSATIVPGSPALLTIERTDIVTVSMPVPDGFAAFVDKGTEAEIRMDSFPGRALKCRLTRIAPSLSPADRSLRVEVDLYNGTADEHRLFLARARRNQRADLKSRTLPVFPQGVEANGAARLVPGMYGRMKLVLRSLEDAVLIPSSAVLRQGGLPYVYFVENGTARRRRVRVEMDDGSVARVFVLEQVSGVEASRPLAERDQIVLTGQGELEDGREVQASLTEWN